MNIDEQTGRHSLRVRPALPTEFALMQDIERDAAAAYGRLPDYAFCLAIPPRDETEHALVRREGVALIAEDRHRKVVGFLLARPVDGRAHVVEIGVRDAHQGHGHGRALMATFDAWARLQGFREATLTTFNEIPWNAPFYARLGYRPFAVGADRPELMAIRLQEIAAGFDRVPRVAMHKWLLRSAR